MLGITDVEAARRMKPNLFIVGAPKCGTTAWFEYLRSHPEIYFPEVKEPHFFAPDMPNRNYVKHLDEYEELFDGAGKKKVIGDASVLYLYSQEAARRIAAYDPNAKIMIFLRDQEDMLLSWYHQLRWMFSESIDDFAKAWRLSGKRTPDSISKHCPNPKLLNYAAIGRFSEQVERYFQAFPPEQIKVFRFRDWAKDPRATYLEILKFLNLEDDGRTDFPRINDAKAHRIPWLGRLIVRRPAFTETIMKPIRKLLGRQNLGLAHRAAMLLASKGYQTSMSDELREEIRRYYEEDNRRIDELLKTHGAKS